MEINTKEIFDRMNLQHIRNYIFGNTAADIYDITYVQHLKEGSRLIKERLKTIYKNDERELDDAMGEYTAAITAYSEVYAEIGMKAGARLLYQLLLQDDRLNIYN